MLKRRKEILKFSGRVHPKLGILSVIIGAVAFIGLFSLSIISSTSKGNGGLIIGTIGLFLFGMSVGGFVAAYKACKQKDIYYQFPIIGLLLNGFLIIFFLILYILGFAKPN